MQALLRGLREHMPPGVTWTEPSGGYTSWLRVPRMRDEQALHRRLLAAGVRLSPGRLYFATPPREAQFRVSVSCAGEDEIATACRRLGRALRAALAR
jgi:DNA-binding transcriptional MocR family regulator